MEHLKRVQMLIEPRQHAALAKIAENEGRSVADITRQVIDLGLDILERKEEIAHRGDILQRARQLRNSLPPLVVDVLEDLRQMRESRDDHIADRGG